MNSIACRQLLRLHAYPIASECQQHFHFFALACGSKKFIAWNSLVITPDIYIDPGQKTGYRKVKNTSSTCFPPNTADLHALAIGQDTANRHEAGNGKIDTSPRTSWCPQHGSFMKHAGG